jgi:hypothetical protein
MGLLLRRLMMMRPSPRGGLDGMTRVGQSIKSAVWIGLDIFRSRGITCECIYTLLLHNLWSIGEYRPDQIRLCVTPYTFVGNSSLTVIELCMFPVSVDTTSSRPIHLGIVVSAQSALVRIDKVRKDVRAASH